MRGQGYYTGTVYETILEDYPTWGSICSGGRYDNLAGYYTDRKLPGVGMSIGLTRFFDLLRDNQLINPTKSTAADVLILPMEEKASLFSLEIAKTLRENNLNAQIFASEGKFKNKMAYANKINVPFVLIIGEEEVETQMVTLKNMTTGQQEKIASEKLSASLRLALSQLQEQKGTIING